jgi:hypothetical protein
MYITIYTADSLVDNGFTPRVLPEIRRNRPFVSLRVYWVVPIVGPFFHNVAIYGAVLRQNPGRVVELRV